MLKYETMEKCPDCDGGVWYAEDWFGDGKCDECHGNGIVPPSEECPKCGGSGVCPTCGGEGYL